MKEVIERMANKVKSAVGKALIEAISDGNEIQLVKVSGLDNETQSDLERVQDYGLTSNPPIGSEAVVLYVGGSKGHGIVIKTDSGEFRVQSLESGEVCIYSKFGQKILLDKNGEIVTSNSGGQTTLDSSGVLIVGDGTDDIATASAIDAYNTIVDTTLTSLLGAVDGLTGGALLDVYDAAKLASFPPGGSIPSTAAINAKADKPVTP